MHNPVEQTKTRTQACVDRLRALPAELQPPYNWQEFQRRSQLRLDATRGGMGWTHMAIAAGVLLIICAVAIWGRIGTGTRSVVAHSWESADTPGWQSDDDPGSVARETVFAARHTRA